MLARKMTRVDSVQDLSLAQNLLPFSLIGFPRHSRSRKDLVTMKLINLKSTIFAAATLSLILTGCQQSAPPAPASSSAPSSSTTTTEHSTTTNTETKPAPDGSPTPQTTT